jgi:hypothetical protein
MIFVMVDLPVLIVFWVVCCGSEWLMVVGFWYYGRFVFVDVCLNPYCFFI